MKQLCNISEYNDIVERYNRKGCFSNDYIQQQAADLVMQDTLFADCYDNNVFLYVKKDVGMRVYYYINDINEKADFNEYKDLVVEILFRGEEPTTEIDYLCGCGFSKNLVRDQYSGMYKDLSDYAVVPGVDVAKAENIEEIEFACNLFNNTFDKLSGDFIPQSQYKNLLDKDSIIIAKAHGSNTILGALHQVKEGIINVIGHVAVVEEARGHGVGKALLDVFIEWNKETEKTRYQLWVQRQNLPAVEMYKKTGFKSTNKSTISLIK